MRTRSFPQTGSSNNEKTLPPRKTPSLNLSNVKRTIPVQKSPTGQSSKSSSPQESPNRQASPHGLFKFGRNSRSNSPSRNRSRSISIPPNNRWRTTNLKENRDLKFELAMDQSLINGYLKTAEKLSITNPTLYLFNETHEALIAPLPCGRKDVFLLNRNLVLGKGGLSSVIAAYHLKHPTQLLAAKIMSSRFSDDAENENKKLICLGRQHAFFTGEEESIIIMDYYQGPTLFNLFYKINDESSDNEDYYIREPFISPLQLLILSREILQAIELIHLENILHGDIKPENFIIGDQVVAVDLSDALFKDEYNKSARGSPGYMSARAASRKCYQMTDDFYSLGMVIAFLITQHNVPQGIAGCLNEYRKKDTLSAITPQMMFKIMPDVFGDEELNPSLYKEYDESQFLIFKNIVFENLKILANSLIKDGLKGSSLGEEIKKIKILEESYDSASRMMADWKNKASLNINIGGLFNDASALFKRIETHHERQENAELKSKVSFTSVISLTS